MIGNYGVEADASESDGPHARAVIVREGRNAAPGGRAGFSDWLAEHGVVGLQGIDTRAITRRLRDGGAVRAAVSSGTATVAEVLDARARRARDGRPGARGPGVAARRPDVRGRRVLSGRTSSSSTTASRARSSASCARPGPGSRSCRGTRPPQTCWPHRPTGSSSPTGPATPPPSRLRRRGARDARRPSRSSGSASATSCSAGPSASTPSSCASATAARTIRCSTSAPAACS